MVNRFAKSPNDATAAAQLGLYYFKLGDIAKAEDPFEKAASIYFPLTSSVHESQSPSAASHDLLPDKATDNQVFKKCFSRYLRNHNEIESRYSLIWGSGDIGDHQISEGRSLSMHRTEVYKAVVKTLYEQILRKKGKLAELLQFQKREKVWNDNSQTWCDSDAYVNAVAANIYESWYCPPHSEDEDGTYQFFIDKDGRIERVAVVIPASSSELEQSILETAQFTFALPKPPIGWTGGVLEVTFNGTDSQMVDQVTTVEQFYPQPAEYVRSLVTRKYY